MPEEGDYEIMPYKEIVALKKEVEALKSRSGASSQDLLNSMDTLTKTMNSMLQLFKSAAEEMKSEDREKQDFTEKAGPMLERLDALEEQNKTIAEGMVAIADMVKEMKGEKPSLFKPRPQKQESRRPKEPILPEYHPPRPAPIQPRAQNPFGGPMPPPRAAPEFSPFGPMPEEPPELPSFEEQLPPPGPMPPGPMPAGPIGPLLPEEPPLFEEKPKKKGLFGRFKK